MFAFEADQGGHRKKKLSECAYEITCDGRMRSVRLIKTHIFTVTPRRIPHLQETKILLDTLHVTINEYHTTLGSPTGSAHDVQCGAHRGFLTGGILRVWPTGSTGFFMEYAYGTRNGCNAQSPV